MFVLSSSTRIATSVGKSKSVVLHESYERLNMHIVRTNAMAILSRCMPLGFRSLMHLLVCAKNIRDNSIRCVSHVHFNTK